MINLIHHEETELSLMIKRKWNYLNYLRNDEIMERNWEKCVVGIGAQSLVTELKKIEREWVRAKQKNYVYLAAKVAHCTEIDQE